MSKKKFMDTDIQKIHSKRGFLKILYPLKFLKLHQKVRKWKLFYMDTKA